jgi:hypothetical protein
MFKRVTKIAAVLAICFAGSGSFASGTDAWTCGDLPTFDCQFISNVNYFTTVVHCTDRNLQRTSCLVGSKTLEYKCFNHDEYHPMTLPYYISCSLNQCKTICGS